MNPTDARLVHEILAQAALADPKRRWLTFTDGAAHSLAEVDTRVDRVVAGLQAAGVEKGDRVAIMAANRIEFLETWFAIHRAGGIAVPVNVSMRGDVLTHVLDLVEPKGIVIEGQYLERLAESIGGREYLHSVWVLEPANDADAAWPGWIGYPELHDAGEPRPVEMSLSDPCAIMYTSGTTGPSKGIVWTHSSTFHMIRIPRTQMAYGPGDVVYTCLPLFHATALIVTTLMSLSAGANMVIAPRFSVSGFWRDVVDHGATGTAFLGAMTQLLIGADPSPLDRAHRLRTAMMVPAGEQDREVFRTRFGLEVVESYGLTDFGWLCWPALDEVVPAGSVGRPHESFEVRLVDENDEDVPLGEPGEIVARPRLPWTTPTGYWGMPEATLESRRNLWFHTGDLMRSDQDGYLYFVDRGKDAMRRRGENVSSFEVERAVASHPAVAECAAYAISSELSEDEVGVAVVLHPEESLEPADLIEAIEGRLPYFAVPRFVRFMSALPKTQTEKVRKDQLRVAGATADTWDREASGYKITR